MTRIFYAIGLKGFIFIAIAYVFIEIFFAFFMPVASIFPPGDWWIEKVIIGIEFIEYLLGRGEEDEC